MSPLLLDILWNVGGWSVILGIIFLANCATRRNTIFRRRRRRSNRAEE